MKRNQYSNPPKWKNKNTFSIHPSVIDDANISCSNIDTVSCLLKCYFCLNNAKALIRNKLTHESIGKIHRLEKLLFKRWNIIPSRRRSFFYALYNVRKSNLFTIKTNFHWTAVEGKKKEWGYGGFEFKWKLSWFSCGILFVVCVVPHHKWYVWLCCISINVYNIVEPKKKLHKVGENLRLNVDVKIWNLIDYRNCRTHESFTFYIHRDLRLELSRCIK